MDNLIDWLNSSKDCDINSILTHNGSNKKDTANNQKQQKQERSN